MGEDRAWRKHGTRAKRQECLSVTGQWLACQDVLGRGYRRIVAVVEPSVAPWTVAVPKTQAEALRF